MALQTMQDARARAPAHHPSRLARACSLPHFAAPQAGSGQGCASGEERAELPELVARASLAELEVAENAAFRGLLDIMILIGPKLTLRR